MSANGDYLDRVINVMRVFKEYELVDIAKRHNVSSRGCSTYGNSNGSALAKVPRSRDKKSCEEDHVKNSITFCGCDEQCHALWYCQKKGNRGGGARGHGKGATDSRSGEDERAARLGGDSPLVPLRRAPPRTSRMRCSEKRRRSRGRSQLHGPSRRRCHSSSVFTACRPIQFPSLYGSLSCSGRTGNLARPMKFFPGTFSGFIESHDSMKISNGHRW